MMISISSLVYDLVGAYVFTRRELAPGIEQELANSSRRCSRTQTLDGGVSVYDTGYSVGDRDISIEAPGASAEAVAFAMRMVRNYSSVLVVTSDGAFTGVPESASVRAGTLTFKILITGGE